MMVNPDRFAAREARLIGYAPAFARVVKLLEEARFVKGVTQIGPSVYTGTETGDGFGAAAWEAAGHESAGVWHVTGHNKGLRWAMGDMTAGVIIPPSEEDVLTQSQEIVRAVIPAHERPPAAYTVGGCARSLINWALDKPQAFTGFAAQLVSPRGQSNYGEDSDFDEEQSFQYHDCAAGRYPKVVLWDVEAYYFSSICRAPCVRVEVRPDGLQWGRWVGSEAERWRDVLAAIAPVHLLRNSVWGVCVGSDTLKRAYTSSRPKDRPGKWTRGEGGAWAQGETIKRGADWRPGQVRVIRPTFGKGPFPGLGLLVARSTAEACAIAAAEVNSVYSTVDSVTTLGDAPPAYWGRLGFNTRIKAEGEADIVARGVWRIGAEHTRTYYQNRYGLPADYVCPVPPMPVPRYSYSVNYHKLWLA